MQIKSAAAGVGGPEASTEVWLAPCGGTYNMAGMRLRYKTPAQLQMSSTVSLPQKIRNEGKALGLSEPKLWFKHILVINLSERKVQKAQAAEGTSLRTEEDSMDVPTSSFAEMKHTG